MTPSGCHYLQPQHLEAGVGVDTAASGWKYGAMRSSELLADAFGRIDGMVSGALDGADAERLNWRAGGTGNSIAWLVWHLCRVQDEQIADVAGFPSVWTAGEYASQFGFALDPADTGYSHNSEQVSAVQVESTELLREYHRAVLAESLAYVQGLDDADLDRIVDRRWNPPVTLGVRLISIVDDCVQHGGQAAYIKGLRMS